MPNAISDFIERAGGGARMLIVLVGIGAVAAIWGFAQWGASPAWVPVSSGLPMSQVSRATQRLDESGIEYRLERGGGLVTVKEDDAARARVVLAAEGLSGVAGRPGFELFDQPSWGMTDFTQRVNYRRALEGELERTISNMRNVDRAEVHLALQETSFLQDAERTAEASVVLRLRSGTRVEEGMVEGIQSLVASSVEGIEPESVAVLNDRGRLISTPGTDPGVGLTDRQLRVQRQIEGYLESKASAMVDQIVGPGNATVRVAASLNFDRIDRTVEALDPDQQVMISEDRSEITPGSAEQGAGEVKTNTVYETTRSRESLLRGGARLERLTVAVVLNDKQVEAPDGTTTFEPRSREELQRVEALVRNAVGISDERGDHVSVVSAPFTVPPPDVPEDTGFDTMAVLQAAQRPAVALVGIMLAFLLTLRIVGSLKAAATPGRRAPERIQGESLPALPGAESVQHVHAGTAHPAVEPQFQLADPAMTARVVRAWMKEA